VVSIQNPVRLDDHSEPRPDLLLLQPSADYYRKRHPQPGEVFLLVEVSDTTLARDLSEKLPAYGRAGIPEIWIVNLNDEVIEIHAEPHFTGYGRRSVLRPGDLARPLAFPDVVVEVAELLKR
jgi:Uma2 family endonuclease